MKIAGAVAIVTGGSSGIGRATALRLVAGGASVVVADVDVAGGRETVRRARASGTSVTFVRTDVSREADVRRMIEASEQTFGGLDILVNNAAVVEALTTALGAFPDLPAATWRRMLDINLTGVILGTQYGIDAMRRRGGGVIVNISSGAGIGYTAHDAPVYAASKAGVARFSAALAPLAMSDRIRVNCVCPGWVDTAMTQRTRRELTPRAWRAIAPSAMSQPEEMAEAVLRFVRDDRLAGRVLLAYEDQPWRLLRRGP